jgi:hypothetical protein
VFLKVQRCTHILPEVVSHYSRYTLLRSAHKIELFLSHIFTIFPSTILCMFGNRALTIYKLTSVHRVAYGGDSTSPASSIATELAGRSKSTKYSASVVRISEAARVFCQGHSLLPLCTILLPPPPTSKWSHRMLK